MTPLNCPYYCLTSSKYEKQWLNLPWHKVRDSVEVKLFSQDGELCVLAKSEGRQAKEIAIRRKRLARLMRKLRGMRRSCPKRDQLLMRVGAAKTEAGRAFGFVKINLPKAGQEVTRETFTFQIDKDKLKNAQLRDGHYLLRTNLVAEDPAVLWDRYMQLVQIEAAFKCLKSELGIRPIYHQLEHRVEAHILVAFLAYCLTVTLKHRLQAHASGLTPRAMLEKLAAIQALDVWLPTTDGRHLVILVIPSRTRTWRYCSTNSKSPCRNSPYRGWSRLLPTLHLSSKCSADLGVASTENKRVPSRKGRRVRKSG